MAGASSPPGGHKRGHIELYEAGRFFTVTGEYVAGTARALDDHTPELEAWHAQVFGAKTNPQKNPRAQNKKNLPADLARVQEALRCIPAFDYDMWLRVGMALHAAGEENCSYWVEWSRTCPEKFDADVCRKKWSSFSAERDNAVTVATIIQLAKEYGWTPEGNGHHPAPWPIDADAPVHDTRGDFQPAPDDRDESENAHYTQQEREPESDATAPASGTAAAYPCLDILWQGVFAEVAERIGKRSWEVWVGIYSALSAVAHRNLHWFYYSDPILGMSYTLLLSPTGAGKNLVANTAQDLLPEGYPTFYSVQSGPGLIPLLTDEPLDNKSGRLTVSGRPALFVSEEWSRLLQVGGIEHSTLIEDLNALFQRPRAWSQSRSHKLKSGGSLTIKTPP